MKTLFIALLAVFTMSCVNATSTKLYSKTLTQKVSPTEKKSPNFKAVDINGKIWTLDDFA